MAPRGAIPARRSGCLCRLMTPIHTSSALPRQSGFSIDLLRPRVFALLFGNAGAPDNSTSGAAARCTSGTIVPYSRDESVGFASLRISVPSDCLRARV